MRFLESQDSVLAEIGRFLTEVAVAFATSRRPDSTEAERRRGQESFSRANEEIRILRESRHAGSPLFSLGSAKPLVVATPAAGDWEGLAIDRANLGSPGFVALDAGKLHGDGSGHFLDEGSLERTLGDWRRLCHANRLQWTMLAERLHRVDGRLRRVAAGEPWIPPPDPAERGQRGLERPHAMN